MEKSKFTIGCFAIIMNKNNEVLLCHRTDHDVWNLPGGVMEHGESPWDCVIREVKEETGLEVEASEMVGVYSKPHENDLVIQFVCEIKSGSLTLNEEADRIEYFSLENIPQNTVPKQVERIHDYFEFTGKAVMKIQTGKGTKDLIKELKLEK